MHSSRGWTSPFGPSDDIDLVVRPLFILFFQSLHRANTALAWSISMAPFSLSVPYQFSVVRHRRFPHARCWLYRQRHVEPETPDVQVTAVCKQKTRPDRISLLLFQAAMAPATTFINTPTRQHHLTPMRSAVG